MKLFRILDPFTITLITVVLLASFFPAEGGFVPFFEGLTTAAIALLFFMHGAKLSREAIIAGGSHWRLHLWVMCSTFVVFPVLGVLFAWWAPVNVDPMLYTGFLYLCILPATVQSAIAFTSLAGGNVAAAVCSASASSLLGIFLSPLLVGLVMNMHGAEGSLEQVGKIMLQLLLPFVLGQNHITLYIVAFAIATLMLTLGGYAGYKYLIVAAAVSVWWLGMALRGYKVEDDRVWARKLFGFSIIAITALSVMMSVDFMVPNSQNLLTYVW